jgi:MarR family transcriptional regulator, organic hydroperoxide resistance regulator
VGDRDTRPVAADHLRLVQEVVWLWVQMQSRLQEHFTALAAEHSLSAIQAKILIQLDRNGPVTMRALAAQLQYDPSNLTSVIDRLEALGAVERHSDPRDRRVKKIILTTTGDTLRAAFWQRLTSEAGPLGALGAKELTQLRFLLQLAISAEAQQTGSHRQRAEFR